MKIPKEQWQKWAGDFAEQEMLDFCKHVPLTVEQVVILKAKIEAAALYGMELAAVMDARGCDLSEAKDCKPALMQLYPKATVNKYGHQIGDTCRDCGCRQPSLQKMIWSEACSVEKMEVVLMNTIDATSANIEWLIDRLYVEGRNLQANGVENPTFVLMTKNGDERDKVAAAIFRWFIARYGGSFLKHVQPDSRFKTSTTFTLPPNGTRVLLMDVSDSETAAIKQSCPRPPCG